MAGCLGGTALAAVCRAYAEDFQGWCGGMPDLFLWRVHGDTARAAGAPFGEARLVEVKSPSDALSQQQIAWIDLLLRSGVRVDELRVQHAEATHYDAMRPSWPDEPPAVYHPAHRPDRHAPAPSAPAATPTRPPSAAHHPTVGSPTLAAPDAAPDPTLRAGLDARCLPPLTTAEGGALPQKLHRS
jgi:hypothetical protein